MTDKTCTKCLIIKPLDEFYLRKDAYHTAYCKVCTNELAAQRKRDVKQKAMEYKGGKCEKCGYDKCVGALQFHHKDPTQKSFSISEFRFSSFTDKLKQELDKCVMLCANCHAEAHHC